MFIDNTIEWQLHTAPALILLPSATFRTCWLTGGGGVRLMDTCTSQTPRTIRHPATPFHSILLACTSLWRHMGHMLSPVLWYLACRVNLSGPHLQLPPITHVYLRSPTSIFLVTYAFFFVLIMCTWKGRHVYVWGCELKRSGSGFWRMNRSFSIGTPTPALFL